MWTTGSSVLLAYVFTQMTASVTCWYKQPMPNYISRDPEQEILAEFRSAQTEESLKLLLVEGNRGFVGGKNHLYHINLVDLSVISDLVWPSTDTSECRRNEKWQRCFNYIRIAVRTKEENLLVCGTNAHRPLCRNHTIKDDGVLTSVETDGKPCDLLCPHDSEQNYTFLYEGGRYYAGMSDANGQNPIITMKNSEGNPLRTSPKATLTHFEPYFVDSMEREEKVFIVYREVAIELPGKVAVSRIGGVCKNDKGIPAGSHTIFHSLFKARLDCFLPGDDHFEFNEVAAVTTFGGGSYKYTKSERERYPIFYGVFNTADNGLGGSAVCAFKFSDVALTLKSRFMEQESHLHKWRPVPQAITPLPHPGQCSNSTPAPNAVMVKFIKEHSLMEDNVVAIGTFPVFILQGLRAKMTQIAVDWQVPTLNNRFYDIIFVGTDDGRVIKGYNAGQGYRAEPVIVEDIQVLEPGEAVVAMQVLSGAKLLVVMSKRNIVTIALNRCLRAETYKACKLLQDPYCPCVE